MKVKEQTRKLASGCSKDRTDEVSSRHSFEVMDRTDVIKKQTRKLAAVSSKHCFEVVNRTDVVSRQGDVDVV
ncbi:hypothetical protein [Streptococcus pneumoniae]|uniref:hypothetical protein n=1 Tax=Streptococcus pneumoniae TaxID=1313 RepID=UPI0015DACA48|nr:hypothetical protein [Streptococcus pneumoniae]